MFTPQAQTTCRHILKRWGGAHIGFSKAVLTEQKWPECSKLTNFNLLTTADYGFIDKIIHDEYNEQAQIASRHISERWGGAHIGFFKALTAEPKDTDAQN